jgi:hypothetical protein
MLEMALRNVALALVPLPFLQIAPSNPTVWRLSSGLYLLSTAIYAVFAFRRARSQDLVSERWLVVPLLILTALTVLTNLANVVGLGGSNAFSLYLTSLLLGLAAAGLLFLSVAGSVFRGQGG